MYECLFIIDKKNYMKDLEHMRGTAKVTETDIVRVEKDKLILAKHLILSSASSKEKEEKREIEFGACLWMSSTSPNQLVAQLQSKSPSIHLF